MIWVNFMMFKDLALCRLVLVAVQFLLFQILFFFIVIFIAFFFRFFFFAFFSPQVLTHLLDALRCVHKVPESRIKYMNSVQIT